MKQITESLLNNASSLIASLLATQNINLTNMEIDSISSTLRTTLSDIDVDVVESITPESQESSYFNDAPLLTGSLVLEVVLNENDDDIDPAYLVADVIRGEVPTNNGTPITPFTALDQEGKLIWCSLADDHINLDVKYLSEHNQLEITESVGSYTDLQDGIHSFLIQNLECQIKELHKNRFVTLTLDINGDAPPINKLEIINSKLTFVSYNGYHYSPDRYSAEQLAIVNDHVKELLGR
jgi:hypothetical protein